MEKSLVCSTYKMGDYGVYEYDPQVDFTQFLGEARQAEHARSSNVRSSLPQSEEDEGRITGEEENRVKKSWRNSLLKWWKPEKKDKTYSVPARSYGLGNQRKGRVSCPINVNGRGAYTRPCGPTSGPLINLLNLTKCKENETPYMCLDPVHCRSGVKAHGPVYSAS